MAKNAKIPAMGQYSFNNISAIVLAAGKGTRMNSDLPKVLNTISGKPILELSLEKLSLLNLGQVLIVVGYGADDVIKAIGSQWSYINQGELLGTGHAVRQALPSLSPECKTVLVVNGDDSAFYQPDTLANIINQHLISKAKMTILTSIQEENDVLGRVIRNKQGKIIDIKHNNLMTEEELKNNNELVCGLYLFDRQWLEEELPKVEKSKYGEYNITGLIFVALSQSSLNDIMLPNPNEWRSVNTQKELENARVLWDKLYDRTLNQQS